MQDCIKREYPSACNMGIVYNGESLITPCGMVTDVKRLHLTVLVDCSIVMQMDDVLPRSVFSFTNVSRVHVLKYNNGEHYLFVTRFY